MANKKTTDFLLITAPTAGDLFEIVDVSDTTDSPQGSSRQVAASDVITKAHGLSDGSIVSIVAGEMDSTAVTATATELNYVDGVTSAIQDQINGKQPSDAQLTDLAGLTPTDNNFVVGNGTNFVTESGATARASLGLVIGTDVVAPNQDTTGKSAKTDALNSATTIINVSSATAPTSGQVLTATSSTAATWQTPSAGGSSTPKVRVATIDGGIKNDATSSSGAWDLFATGTSSSWTYIGAGSGGYYKGASGTGTTGRIRYSIDQYGLIRNATSLQLYDEDPQWFFLFTTITGGAGSTPKGMYGCHESPDTAPLSTTAKHVGLMYSTTAGVITWSASNANGTTRTSTDVTAYVTSDNTENNSDKLFIDMTSGTSIKFYVNNTLAATHSTNLPSGAGNGDGRWLMGTAQNNGGTTNQNLIIHQASLNINAY